MVTFADLGRVPPSGRPDPESPTGLALDGVSLIDSMTEQILPDLVKPTRTELLLSLQTGYEAKTVLQDWRQWGVIRVGDFKLITQDVNWDYDYHLGWTHDCLFGTG